MSELSYRCSEEVFEQSENLLKIQLKTFKNEAQVPEVSPKVWMPVTGSCCFFRPYSLKGNDYGVLCSY